MTKHKNTVDIDTLLDNTLSDLTANEQIRIVQEAKKLLVAMKGESREFPVDAFPARFQAIIREFSSSFSFPPDYYGLGMLVCVATVTGNAFQVELKKNFFAWGQIYAAIIGKSGMGKTPTLDAALGPLYRIQDKYNKEWTERCHTWKNECLNIDSSGLKEEKPPQPHRQRLMINKATLEALMPVLQRNARGALFFREELAGFFKGMNQYRAGDDAESFLEMWGCPANLSIERVGEGKSIFMKHPCISVFGGVQPDIIQAMASEQQQSNGTVARFLFAYPDDLSKPHLNDLVPDARVYQEYDTLINWIDQLPNDFQPPANDFGNWEINRITIPFEPEARILLVQFINQLRDRQNETDDDTMVGILAKLETYSVRFCCILTIMEFVAGMKNDEEFAWKKDQVRGLKVTKQIVLNSIKLTMYFEWTARKVTARLESPVNKLPAKEKAWYLSLAMDIEYTRALLLDTSKAAGISTRQCEKLMGDPVYFRRLGRGNYERKVV